MNETPAEISPYQYWAFISYSRKDEKQARKLHEFIETFGIPAEFVEQHTTPVGESAPARLSPCFRDKDDLPPHQSLPKALQEKLAASRYLVVVCSPNSADSVWVDQEIKDFRMLHGVAAESRIYPFIIAGSPDLASRDCCFPRALREQNPCAPNATDSGEGGRIARLKLIAGMLGVPPDAIIQRDRARRVRRMKWLAVLTIFIAAIIGWLAMSVVIARRDQATQREKTKQETERAKLAAAAAQKAVEEKNAADKRAAEANAEKAKQVEKTKSQTERALIEEGRTWLALGQGALRAGDHLSALMLAGRAVGYAGYGRLPDEESAFEKQFPRLLAGPMVEEKNEADRLAELNNVAAFIKQVQPVQLPLWSGAHSEPLNKVAFSPDGTYIASCSWDRSIRLWDASTGKEMRNLIGHAASVTEMTFSPDGSRIASGDKDNTLKLWDTMTGKEIVTIKGPNIAGMQVPVCFAFSPDSLRLVTGELANTIKVREAVTGKEIITIKGPTPDDSQYLKSLRAAGGDLMAYMALSSKSPYLRGAAFSSDGAYLAGLIQGADSTIHIWNATTGEKVRKLYEGLDQFRGIHFISGGDQLISDNKKWDTKSGAETSLASHEKIEAVSADGRLLAGHSGNQSVVIWRVGSSEESITLKGETSGLSNITFSPDGLRVAGISKGRAIKTWSTENGEELATLLGHKAGVTSFAFNPEGTLLLSGSEDASIKMWDMAMFKELTTLKSPPDHVMTVSLSPDGSLVASSGINSAVGIWDSCTGLPLANLQGEWGTSLFGGGLMNFSPDGKRVASAAFMIVMVWDASTGRQLVGPDTPDDTLLGQAKEWLSSDARKTSPDNRFTVRMDQKHVFIAPNPEPTLDLAVRLRTGLLAMPKQTLLHPRVIKPLPVLHYRQDTLAQLADPKLTPERRAELRMELCAKSSQFRAATAQWQRLLQGEWPGFEGATVPKDQAPATIPADSPIRRLYLLALINATKHPQIHGHPTICQTASQIAPVLTKEMMATPTISLAMMNLMQTLAKDENPAMQEPRAALMKELEEVATKEWLEALREAGSGGR